MSFSFVCSSPAKRELLLVRRICCEPVHMDRCESDQTSIKVSSYFCCCTFQLLEKIFRQMHALSNCNVSWTIFPIGPHANSDVRTSFIRKICARTLRTFCDSRGTSRRPMKARFSNSHAKACQCAPQISNANVYFFLACF